MNTIGSHEEAAYDAVPFPKEPRFWSEPSYIGAAARMFGVAAKPLDQARILEVGCASGGNIIPMAARHPGASFVGIDISGKQIAEARRHAAELGLDNIELRHMNILDGAAALGSFDYVIAHGIYSWIPVALQEPLWRFCDDALAPGGLLYLSYNTLPYWHLKTSMRDLLTFHAAQVTDPGNRYTESISFASDVAAHALGVYGQVVSEEQTFINDQDINYVAHEYFETENHPVYFRDMFAQAQQHGFAYVGEATATYSSLRVLKRDVAKRIAAYAGESRLLREQYTDFYVGRAFRRSIFVKGGKATIPLDIVPEQIDGLHILFKDMPPSVNYADADRAFFFFDEAFFDDGGDLASKVLANAVVTYLAQTLPKLAQSLPVQTVFDAFADQTKQDPQLLGIVRSAILELFYQRKLMLATVPYAWTYDPQQPKAQRLIVSDAAHNRATSVTMLHDEILLKSANSRMLLAMLDGTRTRAMLESEILALYESGGFPITIAPGREVPGDTPAQMVRRYLDQVLGTFAALRMLTMP